VARIVASSRETERIWARTPSAVSARVRRRPAGSQNGEQHRDHAEADTARERHPAQRGPGHAVARRPRHVQPDRDDVEQPADQFDPDRVGLQPEHAGQQRGLDRARTEEGTEVQRGLLADVEPTGLVRGMQRIDDQPSGDQHQHQPGRPEQTGQVQPHSASVDRVAEGDRAGDAEQRADPRQHPTVALVERREEEDRGFEALTQDGQERHDHQREPGARGQRGRRRSFQLALEVTRVALHPDHHVGDHERGDGSDDRLQTLLLPLRQVLRDQPQRHPDRDADQHATGHPDEAPVQHVPSSLLDQERGDDADDE
jgi:hypothetical protein